MKMLTSPTSVSLLISTTLSMLLSHDRRLQIVEAFHKLDTMATQQTNKLRRLTKQVQLDQSSEGLITTTE